MRRYLLLSMVVTFAVLMLGYGVFGKEPIKIVLRSLWHEADAQAAQMIIDMFNEAQDDVNVEHIFGGWTEYNLQLKLSVLAGNQPHIGTLLPEKVLELKDYLTPLDSSPVGNLLNYLEFNLDDLRPLAMELVTIDGHIYGIAIDNNVMGIYYNKDIFRAAGLDPDKPPETLGEFLAACEAIKGAGYHAWHPASDGLPRKLRRAWYILFWQLGGELFDSGYTRATFNNTKGLLALQFLVDCFGSFGFNESGSNGVNQFGAGLVGMMTGGNWYYLQFKDAPFDWGIMPMPSFFGPAYTRISGSVFVVPRQPAGTSPEVYQAIMKTISFFIQNSHIWTMYGGHITAYVPALSHPDLVNSDYWQRGGKFLADALTKGLGHYEIVHPKGSELEDIIQSYVDQAVKGVLSPEEALARAEAECNSILQGQ